jgi:hypothetical protein
MIFVYYMLKLFFFITRHDIVEIRPKLALNTNQSINHFSLHLCSIFIFTIVFVVCLFRYVNDPFKLSPVIFVCVSKCFPDKLQTDHVDFHLKYI